MSKKWAVLIVLGIEVIVYLFLLVGVPAFEGTILCPTCNIREILAPPLVLYFIPGLIGIFMLALIWKQKKEVKSE